MATIVPIQLIAPSALGVDASLIANWRRQNTAGVGTFDIHRTLTLMSQVTGRTATIQQGSTAADTATERIMDAFVPPPNELFFRNWIVAVANNNYFQGFYGGPFNPSFALLGASYGYTYAP